MKGLLRLCAVAALLVCAEGKAGAESVSFDYVWHAGPLDAGRRGGVRLHTGPVPAVLYNGSAPLGGAPVPLGDVAALMAEAPAGAAPLSLDVPFSVTYTLYDGGHNGQLTVAGRLRGRLGPRSSTMTLTFPEPGSLRLGDHLYRVWIDPVTVPPAPARAAVALRTRLAVSEAAHAPEPSALALAAAAGLTLAAFRRVRRPAARRPAPAPCASPPGRTR
jgi:hypothetical protein